MLHRVVCRTGGFRAARAERLESRDFFSTSVGAGGITVVTPDAGSRVIYVSVSSGSDQNSGLSAAAPVASLVKAESLVRDHSADQLLLKAGDSWSSGFPQWTKSGAGALHPLLIGSYGTGARPLLLTGDVDSAFSTSGSTPINDLVISGLQFRSDVRDPLSASFSIDAGHRQDSGFRWYAPTSNLLLQECSFQYYSDNLDIEGVNGPIGGVTIFGCQSLDSYTSSGGAYRSQGLYGYDINGLNITQCLFDHDGWSETVPNAGRSGYDHDIYLASTVLDASVQDNVIANASNNGLLARGGGDIENNFFLDNPSAISYGASRGSTSTPGGVRGTILNNVVMGDASLGSQSYGYGLTIANTAPGAPTLVANNVFTGDTQQSKPAIELTAVADTKNPADCVGINDLVLQNNLFNNWYRSLEIESALQPGSTGLTALNDVLIQSNNFQDAGDYLVRYDAVFSAASVQWNHNNYTDIHGSGWFVLNGSALNLADWKANVEPTAKSRVVHFPNASASEASYDALVGGGGTLADFLTDERAQNSLGQNPAYLAGAINDYVRNALGVPTTPVAIAAATPVTSATQGAAGGTSAGQYAFTVSYNDTQGVDNTSIVTGSVSVVGPAGFNQAAGLIGVMSSADGKSSVAAYSITPPTGNWTGLADGSYAIMMQANQVRNSAGLAVPPGQIGAFNVVLPLLINGTSGNDRISIRIVRTNLIVTVNRIISSYASADVPKLQVYAGDGNDRVTVAAHVMPTLIDGGAGNDIIQTSNGNDTLLGDDGNDTLIAAGGNNLLLGGAGNDQLISGSGPNLLAGGDGNDRLRGGSGDDVLIAGSGADRLQAGRGNQLLIAAAPDGNDPTMLGSLLTAWADSQPYAARITALGPPNDMIVSGSVFSVAGISFAADSTVDTVIGGARPDWFILGTSDRLLHKTPAETSTMLH